MCKILTPLALFVLLSGCCCCCTNPDGSAKECYGCRPVPPINCRGMPYDGGGFGCYRPRGPFWCWGPGECSRNHDPMAVYYEASCNPEWTRRPICHDYDQRIIGMPYGYPLKAPAPPPPVTDPDPSDSDDE